MAAARALVDSPFERHLAQEEAKDLLRFLTCGSVDDGKSTLIGRLLYDSRNVFEDQVHAAAKATRNRAAGEVDLSLLTDGLRAEREQGITIDVAYRYFATARRKFIIADTPGHEQYTRNMATGASTADLAILLIDAQLGVLPQSRRHAFICSLLGIPRFVVAINKMDLAGYDRAVFERIRDEFSGFLAKLGAPEAYFLPVSALAGDNVVSRSPNMPWFDGPSLLEYLETVGRGSGNLAGGLGAGTGFRMPVQRVSRPDRSFRGYAGQVASGTVHPGDVVTALPSGLRSRVKRIATFDGDLAAAFAPMSVTLELEDPLDISRGDMLFAGSVAPYVARRLEAHLVWMDARPLDVRRRYLLKHATQTVSAEVTIRHRIDIRTLDAEPAQTLEMNAIGVVEIAATKPLFFDSYKRNRVTGSFILIDPETNATVAAGLVCQPVLAVRGAGPVTAAERMARWGHCGAVIEIESADVAAALERALFDRGCSAAVVGGQSAASALEGAGMLAILVTGCPPGPAPPRDVPAILRQLEERGVLVSRDSVSAGGGI
ncbi:MAG: sulfate adenylyltransferase subunit CysN [Bryobacteraceae bacterium]|jgi:sulfate adenylyltransferase large subunit